MTGYHRCLASAGAIILCCWVAVTLLASQLLPHHPHEVILPLARPGTVAPDGSTLWLGTDYIGRDVLARTMWAARTSLLVVGIAILFSYLLGLPIAWVATSRRWLARTTGGALVALGGGVPVVVTFVVLAEAIGPSLSWIIFGLILVSLPGLKGDVALLRRAFTSDAADRPTRGQMAAFFAAGLLKRMALFLAIAESIAFLGILPPYPLVTFGGMVNETRQMLMVFPHMAFAPVAAVIFILLGLNLLAAGIEGLLPARLRGAEPTRPVYSADEARDPKA